MNGRRGKRRFHVAAVVVGVAVLALTLLAAAAPRVASPYQRLRIFARVLAHLERFYVEPLDEEEVIFGAIRGMMRSLDPHSSFLTPREFKMLEADTRGRFGGVGVEVGVKNDVLTVITPIAGSPAERAGVQPGDRIVAVEGRLTRNMDMEEVVRVMRGAPGTEVTMTLEREGKNKSFDLTVTREVIRVESVQGELLAPGFPWVKVRTFQEGTTAEVDDAIDRLTREGGALEGVLLDLRRNPGGVLDEAVRLSDLFLPEGNIVTTRGRDGEVLRKFDARRRGTVDEVPMVALIDGASASAAEIVAGALQDHGRAILVGRRSFGKGSVQSIIDLGEGYGLKLTVARYYTPSGRAIQVEGVAPDVVIESRVAPEPDEEGAALAGLPNEGDLPGHLAPAGDGRAAEPRVEIEDYQLRIAFQLLEGLARAEAAGKSDGKR